MSKCPQIEIMELKAEIAEIRKAAEAVVNNYRGRVGGEYYYIITSSVGNKLAAALGMK